MSGLIGGQTVLLSDDIFEISFGGGGGGDKLTLKTKISANNKETYTSTQHTKSKVTLIVFLKDFF